MRVLSHDLCMVVLTIEDESIRWPRDLVLLELCFRRPVNINSTPICAVDGCDADSVLAAATRFHGMINHSPDNCKQMRKQEEL